LSFDTVPPPAHPSITVTAARALVDAQAPEYSHLPLGQHFEGWDCAMYRLGGALAVRLPRTAHAVQFLMAETQWVPRLSAGWSFPYPHFPFVGSPGAGFPWPWAIVTWLPGDMAVDVPLLPSQGPTLGLALAQVHSLAPAEAPVNIEQSVSMRSRDAKVRARIAQVGGTLDQARAVRLWEAALAADEPERSEYVWSHCDLHGANVLSFGGAFGGIVDWGSMAGADPAVDLGFCYLLMPASGVERVLDAYGEATGRVDEAFVARARGIALAKSLGVALSPLPHTRAMGWRGLRELGLAG